MDDFADKFDDEYGQYIYYLNALRDMMHSRASKAGWWSDAEFIGSKYIVPTKLCLIHSEISEAMEGYRKDLMDDKLPNRKMIECELADAMIRIFDLAGKLNLDIGGAVMEKSAYNMRRKDHKQEEREKDGGKKF